MSEDALMVYRKKNALNVAMHKKALVIRKKAEENNFNLTLLALEVAYNRHNGQFRDDGSEYVLHPIRVCLLLIANGILDDVMWAVALLHDVVEDTGMLITEIEELFGREVAYLVELLTKRKGEKIERYILRISKDARAVLIKSADRTDNVGDMIRGFSTERMKEYIEETEKIILELMKETRKKHKWSADNIVAFSSYIKAVLLYAKRVVELEEKLAEK